MNASAAPSAPAELLDELRRLHRELTEALYVRRADGVERVEEVLQQLGEVGSPAGILARAAEALGTCADFDRALLSSIGGGGLQPLSLWAADAGDTALPAPLEGRTMPLAYPLIEAEVVQQGRGAIVSVADSGRRASPELTAAFGWSRYVAVPIRLDGAVAGLLHAERADAGPLDLELAARFAAGLARVYARALLREQVRRRHDQLEYAAQWIDGQLLTLTDEERAGPAVALPGDDRQLAELLTPRELEILRLIARGLTNHAIATALTIGDGTVKYHVKHILRKLGARSRAQAVSLYMRRYADGDAT